jgi:hypothetical protein
VEAAEQVPWTKPADLVYDPAVPLPKLGASSSGRIILFGRAIGKRPASWVSFVDGSCRLIWSATNEATIRAWITRNGGVKKEVP